MAIDKRRSFRSSIDATLTLEIIDNGTQRDMEPFSVTILDVSETGIGFCTEKQLMVGELFKGTLTLWTKEKINFVIKIVRCKVETDDYSYGGIFVGASGASTSAIKIYQMFNE